MTNAVSLSSLLVPNKVVEFEYPELPGFVVQLKHLAKDELFTITKKATKTRFNKVTRAQEDIIDNDLLLSLYTKAVVKGWSGLKFAYLGEFLVADISSFDPDDELPYTEDNALTLMKESSDFESWVTEVIKDVQNFTKSK